MIRTLLTLVLFLGISNIHAQTTVNQYYIGFGYANSAADIADIDVNTLHSAEGANPAQVVGINNAAGGARILVGWRFLENLALEMSFTDFGKIRYYGTVPVDNGTYTESVKLNSGSVTLNASIPLTQSQRLLLKAGAHTTVSTSTYQYIGDTNNYTTRAVTQNDGALIGFGYEYSFTPYFGLRLEFEKFFSMVGKNVWDLSSTNMGFTYFY